MLTLRAIQILLLLAASACIVCGTLGWMFDADLRLSEDFREFLRLDRKTDECLGK